MTQLQKRKVKLWFKTFLVLWMVVYYLEGFGAIIKNDMITVPQQVAWRIDMKSTVQVLPGASELEKKGAKHQNATADSVVSTMLLNKDYFLRSYLGYNPMQMLINARDSMVFTKIDGQVDSSTLAEVEARERKSSAGELLNLKLYPDSLKMLSGVNCAKATYRTKTDSSLVEVWYTQDLPWDYFQLHHVNQVPGIILRSSVEIGHLRYLTEVSRIQKIPVSDTDFVLKSDPSVVFQGKASSLQVKDSRQIALDALRDSLISKLKLAGEINRFTSGAISNFGFVHLKKEDSAYFVDGSGNYAFDTIISDYHPIASISQVRPGWVNFDKDDSVRILIVTRRGKFGLIRADSGWALPAQFDFIKMDFNRYLAIYKNGKMGYADTWGHILVPARFDQVNIMDDNFFDVRIKDKWSIYSRAADKLILPAVYDKFDYCGGCSGGVDYAYASKNGKWGVVGFDGKVLLPFSYEHPAHYGMRSDNWVTSFEQNGHRVVINLATQKVYSDSEYDDMQVISGALCLKNKAGKYGIIDGKGRTLLPFVYDQVGDPYSQFEWGSYIQVYKNGKCGIVDNEGHILIAPNTYKDIYVADSCFGAYVNDEDVIVLDKYGEPITPKGVRISDWRHPLTLHDSTGTVNVLYIIRKKDKEGFYNLKTGDLLQAGFASVDLLKPADSLNNYIVVKDKQKQRTLYSIYGKKILSAFYDDIEYLGHGLAKTSLNLKQGLVDLENGTEISPALYNDIDRIDSRFYLLQRRDSCCKETRIYDGANKHFVNLAGYNKIRLAGSGLLRVDDSIKTYLYSLKKGHVVSKGYPILKSDFGIYEGIEYESHGLFKVLQGKYGYINKQGRVVIAPSFDRTRISKSGLIQLRKDHKDAHFTYQYADTTGHFLSDAVYDFKEEAGDDYPYHFQIGQYLVISHYDASVYQNLMGLMDQTGKVIVKPNYTKVLPSKNGNGFMVERFGRWGLLDGAGKLILPTVLDNIYVAPSYPRTEMDIRYPVLCELKGMYFYVTSSGGILPFITKNIESHGIVW